MAQAVARALAEERNLVVQAGTGTGKSLAYLLPAVQARRRVVVATATKALQDQLAGKDLPFLAEQLGKPPRFSFAVVKGRSNYLCRQRVAEASAAPATGHDSIAGRSTADTQLGAGPPMDVPLFVDTPAPGDPGTGGTTTGNRGVTAGDGDRDGGGDRDGDGDPDLGRNRDGGGSATAGDPTGGDHGAQMRALMTWASTTATGDRSDLAFEPHPRVWAALSVSARECPGAYRCPSGTACFAEWARTRAASADVVVVNTHLYATHVASDGAVLPEHDVLILDEVHEVEDIMTSGLGVELTAGRIRAIAQTARGVVGADDAPVTDDVLDVAGHLDRVLGALVGRRVTLGAARSGTDDRAPSLELQRVIDLARGRVVAMTAAVRRNDAGATGHLSADAGADPDSRARRARVLSAAGHLVDDLDVVGALDADHVAWVEASGPGGRTLTLRAAPIEIGPVLSEKLWPRVTAVLTSATVPRLVERRLGLPGDRTDRLDVGSPFPYGDRALLYCAAHLPDRRNPDATAAVHAELAALITAAGGRTLALFTSWRAMQAAVDALRVELPYTVLAQNELPKPKLLEAFAGDESACLFATLSFWQGVDVPGATLSLVTIDRLPFPRPDDPLLQARRDRAGGDAFRLVDLPRATTLLAQGAGRLIRSLSDTGVVAVLDRRLATAGYRGALIDALPPMRVTTRRAEALAFLRSIAADDQGRQQRRDL